MKKNWMRSMALLLSATLILGNDISFEVSAAEGQYAYGTQTTHFADYDMSHGSPNAETGRKFDSIFEDMQAGREDAEGDVVGDYGGDDVSGGDVSDGDLIEHFQLAGGDCYYDAAKHALMMTGAFTDFLDGTGQDTLDGNSPLVRICPEVETIFIKKAVFSGSMESAFAGLKQLSTFFVNGIDTSEVTDMKHLFYGCSKVEKLDLRAFDNGKVTDLSAMFYACENLQSIRFGEKFSCLATINMNNMFRNCTSLTDIIGLRPVTSEVTDMNCMFGNCSSLVSLDLSGWDTKSVRDMRYMFYRCEKLESINLQGFTTGNVTSMAMMFYMCSKLSELDLSMFDTSQVTDFSYMFCQCIGLKTLDVSSFDTKAAVNMKSMFMNCALIENLDVSGFQTPNLKYASHMFTGCQRLTLLNLRGFDVSKLLTESVNDINVNGAYLLMSQDTGLKRIYTPKQMGNKKIALPLVMSDIAGRKYIDIQSGNEGRILYSPDAERPATLQFKANGGKGTMDPQEICELNPAGTIPSNVFTREGYRFNGWNTKSDGTGKTYANKAENQLFSQSEQNVVLYAQWKPITYKISYRLSGGKNHKLNPTAYTAERKTTTLRKPTKKGYHFDGWYTDRTYKKKVTKLKKGSTGNLVLYAKWTPIKYSISYRLYGGKNHKKNPASYKGTSKRIKLYKPQKTGYKFMGWYTSSKYKKKVSSIKAGTTGRITLYARWKPLQYRISYRLNGGKNASKNKRYYTADKSVKLYKPVKAGYKFLGWYSNRACTKRVISIRKGNTGNKTLYAKWMKL